MPGMPTHARGGATGEGSELLDAGTFHRVHLVNAFLTISVATRARKISTVNPIRVQFAGSGQVIDSTTNPPMVSLDVNFNFMASRHENFEPAWGDTGGWKLPAGVTATIVWGW
jgi:hypothetical protein